MASPLSLLRPAAKGAPVDLSLDPRCHPQRLGPPDGPQLLALHGFTGTPSELLPLLEALAVRGVCVHAPLLAGHGSTADQLAASGASAWEAGVNEAFAAMAPERPVHLLGLSMGAMLAVLLARANPGRVASLTLLAPAADFHGQIKAFFEAFAWSPALARQVPRWPKGGLGMEDQVRAKTLPCLDEVPTRLAAEVLPLLARARAAAPEVGVPSLVVAGRRDGTVSFRAIEALVGALRPAPERWLVLPRSGHLVAQDVERERLITEVSGFLQRHGGVP